MKNLKKVLALVMACAMLFTMSSFAFTDVAEDASYLEAVTMLSKLGIINGYEDGTFLPDNTITRAEAAKVLVCALNAAEQAEGMAEDNIFTDVPGSHWAAGYVNYASNFGIIAGRGNGIFDPEAPVTYEEIVKMVVAMLGYTPVANVKGGYPTGYLYVANNMLKITKGATGVTGDAAKRWVVARLLFNALEAKIMEQDVWSASDPEYVQGDQTLLKDYLEVTKIEGIVTETFYSAATVDKEDQEVEITTTTIDGYSYKNYDDKDSDYIFDTVPGDAYTFEANGTGAENYFGYTITAYVRDFEEDDELVAVAPKGNKNATLEIAFDEFEADSWKDNKSTYYTFEYYESLDDEEPVVAKVRKEVVEKEVEDAFYALNGEVGDISSFISDIAGVYGEDCDVDGNVRLLDNDGNGIYDFIFVEETTEEIAVKSINEKNYKVTGKTGTASMVLDPESDDYYVAFYKDGAVASFEDIAEDDILTIVELYDGNVKKVYISSETVEGRVTSTTKDYKIAGAIYSKSNEYSATISKGDEGTFFLNYNGKIAYAEAEKVSGGNYAFVLDVNTREPIFGTPIYTVLMMNEKGEWIQAELAAKVSFYTFDGTEFVKETIEIEDEMADIETASAGWFTATLDDYYELGLGEDLEANRVIKYALNSAGEIASITIPTAEDAEEEDFRIAAELDENEYNAERNRLVGKTGVAENAVVFAVDVESNDLADVSKKKEVSIASASLFKDEEVYSGLAFDDVDDAFNCLVVTSSEASIAEDAALLVVDEIYEEENDEEEAYLVITGYMNGEEVTLETVADTDLASAFTVVDLEGNEVADFYENYDAEDYTEGAVLEVALDDAGLVTDIKVVYTKAEDFDVLYDTDYDYEDEDGIAYFAGLLIDEEVDGNYTMLGAADGVTEVAEINVKNARIYSVDMTRKTTKFAVEDSIDSFLDTLIYDDEDRTILDTDTMEDEESEYCFAVAKVVDGYAIDVVVYTVVYGA
jgi:hypothetical protein